MADYLTGRLGVQAPITPGVLPILNARQIKRFTALCGATLPAPLVAALDRLGDDDEAVTQYGIEFATRQCEELLAAGRARAAPVRTQPLALGGRDPPQPRPGVTPRPGIPTAAARPRRRPSSLRCRTGGSR